jgi:hypothetical protein
MMVNEKLIKAREFLQCFIADEFSELLNLYLENGSQELDKIPDVSTTTTTEKPQIIFLRKSLFDLAGSLDNFVQQLKDRRLRKYQKQF